MLTQASMTFTQDGNTLGTTDNVETITIDLEYQLPGDEPFAVLITDGWSIDNPAELTTLINRVIATHKQ